MSKIGLIIPIISFFSLLAFGLPPGVSIQVMGEIIHPKPPALTPGAEITAVKGPSSGYVLEDLDRHREGGVALALNRRLAQPHLRCFWWDGQSLCRNFLWPVEPVWGDGPKFSGGPDMRLVKKKISFISNMPSPESFRQAQVAFAPAEKPGADGPDWDTYLADVKKRLLGIKSELEKTDTRALRRGRESRVAPLVWSPHIWETNRSPWGLGSLECLGGLGETLVYRMRLAHSDTELARRESSVAHAYFAYVLEGPGHSLSVILTTAAFSVWIK